MQLNILSKSKLGWWSVGLIAAWFLVFVLADVIAGPGPEYKNLAAAYTFGIIDAGIAIAAAVTGLVSLVKNKERAFLVFFSTAVGLYASIGGISLLFAAR